LRNTLAIARKELRVYFGSPYAYVIMGLFLVVTGVLFVNSLEGAFREASMRVFFAGESEGGLLGSAVNATFFFLLLGPILTMRLLAEETKLGTIELLLTQPINDYEVVLGKFLAGLVSLLVLLLLTLFYPLLLIIFANPDIGPILSGYLGATLLGALFVAVGLFASSLTNNQIVAVMIGLVIFFLFWFIGDAAQLVRGTASGLLQFMSVRYHYEDLAKGIIDTQHIIFLLALTSVFVFFTVRSLETRRWR
jgi:ABC-2 type transport system permease protein